VLKRIFAFALLVAPLAAWAFVKPIRVLAPTLAGVTCVGNVCVDDLSRLPEAQRLAGEAIEFVQSNIGKLQEAPRMIFCSGRECSKSFGFTYDGAYNVGTYGLVISYRGWHPYFVRHELIHHLQNERLGSLNAWIFKPNWFKEGMAYSLSQDPRRPLPEALESYCLRYEAWAKGIVPKNIWAEAEHLKE